jgi:hypothetical protein
MRLYSEEKKKMMEMRMKKKAEENMLWKVRVYSFYPDLQSLI